jgi:hypothetical protein
MLNIDTKLILQGGLIFQFLCQLNTKIYFLSINNNNILIKSTLNQTEKRGIIQRGTGIRIAYLY